MENLGKKEENKNYPSLMAQLSGVYPFTYSPYEQTHTSFVYFERVSFDSFPILF